MINKSVRSQTQVSEITSQACDSRHHDEDISLLHDSHSRQPRVQQASWKSAENECFQDIFDGLPNLHHLDNICADNKLPPSTLDMRESPRKTKSTNQDTEVVVSESIRKKRTRSAEQIEVHNMSERKRRNKIKEKMNTLQELVPNCNKLYAWLHEFQSDKASMLDDAIEYIKVMKLQVHMAREAMWRTGCQGITNTPQMIPQSSTPSMPMEFGMGMGMVNICGYSSGGTCHPLPQFQSTTINQCSRLSLFSGPRSPVPFPQFQAAPPSFMTSQVVPSDGTASSSSVQPQLMPKDFSYTFSPSKSQFSRDTNHNYEMPIQKPRQ